MVISPFPEYIGFSVKTKDTIGNYALTPDEARLLHPRAVQKRREEFILGRAACYTALKQVGFSSPPPVLKGKFNEPVWPLGLVGAITHTRQIAICAVGPASKTAGLGVDIEEMEGVENEIPRNAYHHIALASEQIWINADPGLARIRIKQLFSAKEAGFKAFFPHALSFLDFKDAELIWNEKKESFSGRLLRPIPPLFPKGYPFEIGSSITQNRVFSYIMLPSPDTL